MGKIIRIVFVSILMPYVSFSQGFLRPSEFKVIENRRVKSSSVQPWNYSQQEIRNNTYLNFSTFFGGLNSDLFEAANYRNVAYVYVGANINHPDLGQNSNEIHLPLYLLDVENNENLVVKGIAEGINLLQKIFFRADKRSESYLKMEFRLVSEKMRIEFDEGIERAESNLSKFSNQPLTQMSAGFPDRDVHRLRDDSELIFESIDVMQRLDLNKELLSVVYIIQPLDFKKGFEPKSFITTTLEVDRDFDPLIMVEGSELRFPYVILDVNLSNYVHIESLPSNFKSDFRCSKLREKTPEFTATIDSYESLMTQQQRIFETNLNNIFNEYIYLIDVYQGLQVEQSQSSAQVDDEGFLIAEDEVEISSGYGGDELVREYCNLKLHIKEFQMALEANKNATFTGKYSDNIKDLMNCLNLNILNKIQNDGLLNRLKSACK